MPQVTYVEPQFKELQEVTISIEEGPLEGDYTTYIHEIRDEQLVV
ncbi:MAG: hypothetical protein ABEJ65_08655, partial [bacterium]